VTSRVSRFFGAGVLGLALACQGAAAQDYDRPPGDVPGDAQQSENAGALALRIDRLEAALRRATGQIEDLQNENRKLSDQLRKFREDVEFRLSGKTGAAALPVPGPVVTAPEPQAQPTKLARRDDAFDPDANPNAPGAPRPMGSTPPSAPLQLGSRPPDDPKPTFKPLPTPTVEASIKKEDEPSFVAGGVPFADSKEQFKAAMDAFTAGQYADAESQFKAYIEANKGTSKVADAIFYIGETYLQRSRPREAAEQYLEVSTKYPKAKIAPDAMMRLGLALSRLGNNEQACAAFAEAGKRYPTAKAKADHESQTHRCS